MSAAARIKDARLEPRKVDKENLSVTVPPDLAKALREYADRKDVTVSSVVAVAVTEYLQGEASK